MVAKLDGELTVKEARFAALLAQGKTQAAAYRSAFTAHKQKPQTVYPAASKLAAKSNIRTRVRELLENARIEDIDSPQMAFMDLMQDIDGARKDRNWSAVMAGHDKRLKVWGMLKERHIQEKAETLTDEQIIKELGQGDPAKEAMVKSMIGYRESAAG
jgi:hypothetical protein